MCVCVCVCCCIGYVFCVSLWCVCTVFSRGFAVCDVAYRWCCVLLFVVHQPHSAINWYRDGGVEVLISAKGKKMGMNEPGRNRFCCVVVVGVACRKCIVVIIVVAAVIVVDVVVVIVVVVVVVV